MPIFIVQSTYDRHEPSGEVGVFSSLDRAVEEARLWVVRYGFFMWDRRPDGRAWVTRYEADGFDGEVVYSTSQDLEFDFAALRAVVVAEDEKAVTAERLACLRRHKGKATLAEFWPKSA